jgi:hypothetical protein
VAGQQAVELTMRYLAHMLLRGDGPFQVHEVVWVIHKAYLNLIRREVCLCTCLSVSVSVSVSVCVSVSVSVSVYVSVYASVYVSVSVCSFVEILQHNVGTEEQIS